MFTFSLTFIEKNNNNQMLIMQNMTNLRDKTCSGRYLCCVWM